MKDDLTTTRNVLNTQRKNKRKLEINDALLLLRTVMATVTVTPSAGRKTSVLKRRCLNFSPA